MQVRVEQLSEDTRVDMKAVIIKNRMDGLSTGVVDRIRSGLNEVHNADVVVSAGGIQHALVLEEIEDEGMRTQAQQRVESQDHANLRTISRRPTSDEACVRDAAASRAFGKSICAHLVEDVKASRNPQTVLQGSEIDYLTASAEDPALGEFQEWLARAQSKGKVSAHAASSALSGLRLAQLALPGPSPEDTLCKGHTLCLQDDKAMGECEVDVQTDGVTEQFSPGVACDGSLSPKQRRGMNVLSPDWRTVEQVGEAVACVQHHLNRFTERDGYRAQQAQVAAASIVMQHEWDSMFVALDRAKSEQTWETMRAALGTVSQDTWERI